MINSIREAIESMDVAFTGWTAFVVMLILIQYYAFWLLLLIKWGIKIYRKYKKWRHKKLGKRMQEEENKIRETKWKAEGK